MSKNTAEITKKLAEVEKLADSNNIPRAIKICQQILKKTPNHPETIAYLAYLHQVKKEKAQATKLIGEAVRSDMKNARIWKLNGLILKKQGDYTKAAQALTMSFRLDPKDDIVQKELCSLYLYERNYKLFLDQSNKLLATNSQVTAVMRYVLALDLNGRPADALKLLDVYESNMTPLNNEEELLFRNELGLYHSELLLRLEKYEEAIKFVTEKYMYLRDSIGGLEVICRAHVALKQVDEAVSVIHKMLEYYPEDGDYFQILESILSPENYMKELQTIKDKYKSRYAEVRILELMEPSNPQFEQLLKTYLVPYLIKGAPSVYTYLAELSQEKLEIAVKIAKETEVPLCYEPIVKLFIANVFAARGDYKSALSELDAALQHTPTCLDILWAKARFLKRAGMVSQAADCARQLGEGDPNDRNSNTLLVNYLLKNGEMKAAFELGRSFSLDHKHLSKILISQNNKFYLLLALCFLRGGDIENAKNYYEQVITTFNEFRKSQFNYLGWGMRRIHSLFHILKWSDNLVNEKVFGKAFVGLAQIALAQNDLQSIKDLALRMTNAKTGLGVAYAAVYFALHNEPLPAIKCFRKITGSEKFLAAPAVAKLMGNLGSINETVKEVANQHYEAFNETPSSFKDTVSSARGHLYVKEVDTAKSLMKKAATDFEYTYKDALDLYIAALRELNDEAFATEIENAIHQKYADYQVKFPEYQPFNFDKNSEEYKAFQFAKADDDD
ncbi:TPR Domain containing protein [Tritrichomonas foetus]|uniref:TPR Domain containing protein n=1 Tax=Tritrichomonas foetus TaxID=1144522 RepID=A0A1J4K1P7_9EUKA|nr:TPR Domain containing protein [Tritrichomonas foetus]|eukprot:OHT04712.1 TPR Domain containing protein [Tritrichomonas foetus]